jgi:hypothetical protein
MSTESVRLKLPDNRTEKQVQHAIMKTLRQMQFCVYNLSQPRNSMQAPGLADLYVAGWGVCAWIEVKRAKGKQSEAQALFEHAVITNDGHYLLARNEADVIEWAKQYVKGAA